MRTKLSTIAYLLVAVLAIGLSLFVVHAWQNGSNTKTITINGCLQTGDEANEFAITGEDGKKYELTSNQVVLKDHVGHKVAVTGTMRQEDRDDDEDERKEAGPGKCE
jgi:hypothetical protein